MPREEDITYTVTHAHPLLSRRPFNDLVAAQSRGFAVAGVESRGDLLLVNMDSHDGSWVILFCLCLIWEGGRELLNTEGSRVLVSQNLAGGL